MTRTTTQLPPPPAPDPIASLIPLVEVAEILGKLMKRRVAVTTVWQWVNNGMSLKSKGRRPAKLEARQIGRYWYSTREACEQFVAYVNDQPV